MINFTETNLKIDHSLKKEKYMFILKGIFHFWNLKVRFE